MSRRRTIKVVSIEQDGFKYEVRLMNDGSLLIKNPVALAVTRMWNTKSPTSKDWGQVTVTPQKEVN